MKRKIFTVLLLTFFMSQQVFAAQFDGFKWGVSPEAVQKKLKKEGKLTSPLKDGMISYRDKLVNGVPCMVWLSFVDKFGLVGVEIHWSEDIQHIYGVELNLLDVLYQKYGRPEVNTNNSFTKGTQVRYDWFISKKQKRYPDISVVVTKIDKDKKGNIILRYVNDNFNVNMIKESMKKYSDIF